MLKIREQIDRFSQQAKECQHPVFKFYNFPNSVFTPRFNKDYTNYSSQVRERGGMRYYTPSGWRKFALYVENPFRVFTEKHCVCYFTAGIRNIHRIVTTGKFQEDQGGSLLEGEGDSFVYVTPFIDSLLYSGSPCSVPEDETFNLGSCSTYRVVLQCQVKSSNLLPIQNQYPHNYPLPTTVYQANTSDLTPVGILIKKLT